MLHKTTKMSKKFDIDKYGIEWVLYFSEKLHNNIIMQIFMLSARYFSFYCDTIFLHLGGNVYGMACKDK